MLSEEKNKLLTEVGPGTPMGDYLRRYWHPIAGVSEFDDKAARPIRLFGEDLVLYKDLSGNYGLVNRYCAHRHADLSYGYVEQCGIRCCYHGWQYDQTGQCVHQPFEEAVDPSAKMRKETRIKAYPVKEKAGLLWAYMGPDQAPELPDWELFNFKNGFAQAIFAVVPCNWLQCQENSIDPVHFEWTHNNWITRQNGDTGPYAATHLELKFEEFEHGFVYKRVREGESKDGRMWQTGRVTLWPNGFYLGHHFEWRVPIDDENTLSVLWVFSRVPKEQEPYVQDRIPSWYGPVKDPETGRWITSHVANQDFTVWVSQGRITDRTNEYLGRSDEGIIKMRNRFFKELKAVERGAEPKGLIRDPAKNKNVVLPSACREELIAGMPRKEQMVHPLLAPYLRYSFFQQGQPRKVAEAYEEAVGQKLEDTTDFMVHGARHEDEEETVPT